MSDYPLTSTWAEVDAAAQAVKNGLPKANLSGAVQASLEKADGAVQVGDQATKTSSMTQAVGVDSQGKLWVDSSTSVVCEISLDDDEYVCDTSFSDLADALAAHSVIECKTPEGLAFCQGFKGTNYYLITFTVQSASGTDLSLIQYRYDEDGSIERKVFSASALTDEVKTALMACFNGVAWDEGVDGQALIDGLEAALYPEGHLVSITAAYNQDHAIYNTDSLETVITTINYDLTVVANYSDGTSEPLSSSDYTITGTVEAGASVPFTVTYEGKTATINVLILDNTSTPIYELQSAVSTNDYDTNVKLFDTPKSFTILCEANANVYNWNSAMNPAIFGLGTGNTFKAGYTQNVKKVDNGQVTGDYTYYYCGFACNYSGDSFTGKARSLYSKENNAMSIRRIAVTYDHVTRKVSAFCANYPSLHAPTAGWWILSGDITSETTIKLNIGTSSTCTTNKFNVYDTILSDAQINRFLDEGVA